MYIHIYIYTYIYICKYIYIFSCGRMMASSKVLTGLVTALQIGEDSAKQVFFLCVSKYMVRMYGNVCFSEAFGEDSAKQVCFLCV